MNKSAMNNRQQPAMFRHIGTALCLGLLLLPHGRAKAQADALPSNRHTAHATLFGAGSTSLYDTYLSPSTYRGWQAGILHETLRPTHWAGGRVTVQSIADGFIASATNSAASAREYAGKCNYSIGWHYNWLLWNRLRIMAGGEVHAGLGFIYNLRNSNNPVQAKAEADAGATAAVIWPFRIRKTPLVVRYQFGLLLLGGMFSPRYGQSYYEMAHSGYERNIRFTWPGNAPSMRHLLTLDFTLGGYTFRAGYLCDIRQSHVNGIRSHIWNHSFMLGYVKHFDFVKRTEAPHRPFVL